MDRPCRSGVWQSVRQLAAAGRRLLEVPWRDGECENDGTPVFLGIRPGAMLQVQQEPPAEASREGGTQFSDTQQPRDFPALPGSRVDAPVRRRLSWGSLAMHSGSLQGPTRSVVGKEVMVSGDFA